MNRSHVDRRARNAVVPRQYVSEATFDPRDKHPVRCECPHCEQLWQIVREGSR
jgi:hypothetical protein